MASSELREAALLLQELAGIWKSPVPPLPPAGNDVFPSAAAAPPLHRRESAAPPGAWSEVLTARPAASPPAFPAVVDPPQAAELAGGNRADRLENILEALCRRAGLAGAVAADESGLALAATGGGLPAEVLEAFTSVLGEALERAGRILGRRAADTISMDLDYSDKLVLRRFDFGEQRYSLMAICPQGVDERSEFEVSIGQIVSVLSRR
jgi:hypothetical protein